MCSVWYANYSTQKRREVVTVDQSPRRAACKQRAPSKLKSGPFFRPLAMVHICISPGPADIFHIYFSTLILYRTRRTNARKTLVQVRLLHWVFCRSAIFADKNLSCTFVSAELVWAREKILKDLDLVSER